MSQENDLNVVIKDLIKEYLIPEYPIYRVKYVHTYIHESDDEISNNTEYYPYVLRSRVVSKKGYRNPSKHMWKVLCNG